MSLDFILLVNGGLALGKVGVNLLKGRDFLLGDPRVADDVSHGGAGCRIKLEHSGYQVAELLWEEVQATSLILGMRLPEEVGTVGTQKAVEGV